MKRIVSGIVFGIFSVILVAVILNQVIVATVDEECAHQLSPLVGAIDTNFIAQIQADVNKCLLDGHRTTRLIINSRGGDLNAALAMYAILRNSPGAKKLGTVAVGQVASSAVIIFLAGEHREISCNSYLMVHNHEFYFKEMRMGRTKLAEINVLYNKLRDAQIGVITSSTRLTADQVGALLERSATISAEEAVRLGFANKIIGQC